MQIVPHCFSRSSTRNANHKLSSPSKLQRCQPSSNSLSYLISDFFVPITKKENYCHLTTCSNQQIKLLEIRSLELPLYSKQTSLYKQHHHLKQAELLGCKGDYCIARLDDNILNPKLPDFSQVSLRFTKFNMIRSDNIGRGNSKKFLKNRKVFIVDAVAGSNHGHKRNQYHTWFL